MTFRQPRTSFVDPPRATRTVRARWPLTTFVIALAATLGSYAEDAVIPGMQTGVRVSETGDVDLHVEDMSLANVLRLLSLNGNRNIVSSPKVKGTVTANLYKVTFDQALQAVLTPNGATFQNSGNFIYVYTNEEVAEMNGAANVLQTRVFTLNYISAADAKIYITPLLGEGGSVAASPPVEPGLKGGAGSGENTSAAQDFVLVTAPARNLKEVERVLRELDLRPQQVLIEATILRAQLRDDNALGIDFTVVGGVDLELLGSSSDLFSDVVTGALPQDRFELFNAGADTGFTGDVPTGGLQLGIVKDNVALFLRALEQITDTTVLANPKVLALNRQKGYVIVGRRDGYLTTTVTETQAIQSVEFLETGTQLVFRPFVGTDGFIRVELHPEDSVGFVNAQGLPSKQTTEVTTNIIVRDGETILIGGLFREVTTVTKKQVPGLGTLPGVGALFRSTEDSVEREEVIILLTIHVVKDHDAFGRAAQQTMENIDRIRIGTRQGLMWHGRGRLAQAQYQKACEAFEANNHSRALWYVNLALGNDCRMLPAIELKEKITGKQTWEDDGAAGGRGFVRQLISQERGKTDPAAAPPGG